ncbi:unnamed protein product [Soboliphyme baturini]|uniref:Sec3-PIP2_bind domain-containing protein n=1 Tax=Soboliphyme baturini TaxID=241478 RepID=A0A183IQA5_9BILA|nr:unnamed protein product [Soboliphyme baturini]
MSSVTKTALQRDVFEQHDERIQGFICVTGITRKKKHSVLCLTISYLHPVTVRLHELRRSDKASQWEKKNTWLLNELKVVDGINPRKQSPEFHFTVDKLYRWLADSANLKDPFIRQMWKVNSVIWRNLHLMLEPEAADEYQPISDKEEADFRLLISKFNLKITDAEKFTELLTRELQLLDGANIQAIVGSEEQIAELLNVVDEALNEASRLEQVLVGYDDLLAVLNGIEMMEEKDLLINTYFTNRQRLMNDLEAFIVSLSLFVFVIGQIPLFRRLIAVEQFAITFLFVETSVFDLTLFQVQETIPVVDWSLPKHDLIFTALKPFRDLISWLKAVLPQGYQHFLPHSAFFLGICLLTFSYIVYLLAFLTERVMINDSAEHSSIILGKFVVLVKRRFDTFMEGTLQNMSYSKSVKRAKLGILPALRQFQVCIAGLEEKYEGFQRRGDLDRWYPKFVDAICEAIEKAAEDPYSKSPPAVVQMENYHNLHCVLSHLKISCLNAARKQIKVKYQRALDSYVKECLGKPLEKLQIFLEQVEELLDQGMKPEDISFQQAFNKQEIRRLLNLYSGKEVQKGLKALYNTIEQHLSTETNLLQVVWHNMQEEFIHQYEHNEQLIATCYANSDLQLEFSVDDLLRYFSEIALQH